MFFWLALIVILRVCVFHAFMDWFLHACGECMHRLSLAERVDSYDKLYDGNWECAVE